MNLPLILFVLIIIGLLYLIFKINKSWYVYPTIEEYWTKYKDSKTSNGTKCYKCNSSFINHKGWFTKKSSKRIHYCHQCGTYLYRRKQ